MENTSKPPIGVEPWYIHNQERIEDILDAIERYGEANIAIPKVWIKELRYLYNIHSEIPTTQSTYKQCAFAVLTMRVQGILSHEEHNAIMDKLNKAHEDGVI